jgi:hypothetical protein
MTLEQKQSSAGEVALRVKRALVGVRDIYRVAIDYESDPATLKLWNTQSYLLAGLEEVCRSVRVNLRDYRLDEAIEWEPALRASAVSSQCDEVMDELRSGRLRRLLESRADET